jgi:hypothetical protein
MQRLRDVLGREDLVHLRVILGEHEDPTFSETRRRHRVNQIAMDDTYVAEQARGPFETLSQDDRESLLSDVVWQLTCFVEGSITKGAGDKGILLDYGFKLVRLVQDGKPTFCVVKHD